MAAAAMTIETATILSRINERGLRLEADGYDIEAMEGVPGAYYVHKAGDPVWVWYLTSIGERPHCQCEAFAKWGDCKHRVACARKAQEEAWADARAAELAEWQEYGRFDQMAGKF